RLGLGGRTDFFADLRELGTDLLIGQAFELGLERIGLVDPWLDPSQLTVIRIDETGKETHRTVEYRAPCRTPPGARPGVSRATSPDLPRLGPELRPVADDEQHEGGDPEPDPEEDRHRGGRRVH